MEHFGKKEDKVCIIGFAPNRSEAPWNDMNGFEWWGFNDPMSDYPLILFDRWFQLHQRRYLSEKYLPWLDSLKTWQKQERIPIYTVGKQEDIPCSIDFPKDEIEKLTPHGWYHAGTFDWLVAMAIWMGFEEIQIYGLGYLTMGGEPVSACKCLEYWLGVAEGRGIKTVTPEKSDVFAIFQLLQTKRQYGWDESRPIVTSDL